MYDLIINHQLNIMLALSGACGICVVFVLLSKAISESKKRSLFLIELCAMFLLLVDIGATMYDGDTSVTGYWMVRICNFFVFILTLSIIYFFNMYLRDVFTDNEDILVVPKRLRVTAAMYYVGIVMIIIAQFTDLYYYFDETNKYVRASGYFISYIFPIVVPITQLSFVLQYYKKLHAGVRRSLLLFPLVPISAAVIQVIFYGIILVDMSIACMAIQLYLYALLDVNKTLDETHKVEVELIKNEEKALFRLFRQVVTAFASAIDAKDENTKGHAARVADYAKKISQISGKSNEECEAAYFTGLLHDVGKISLPDKLLKKRANVPLQCLLTRIFALSALLGMSSLGAQSSEIENTNNYISETASLAVTIDNFVQGEREILGTQEEQNNYVYLSNSTTNSAKEGLNNLSLSPDNIFTSSDSRVDFSLPQDYSLPSGENTDVSKLVYSTAVSEGSDNTTIGRVDPSPEFLSSQKLTNKFNPLPKVEGGQVTDWTASGRTDFSLPQDSLPQDSGRVLSLDAPPNLTPAISGSSPLMFTGEIAVVGNSRTNAGEVEISTTTPQFTYGIAKEYSNGTTKITSIGGAVLNPEHQGIRSLNTLRGISPLLHAGEDTDAEKLCFRCRRW